MRVSASYLEKLAKDWQAAYETVNHKIAPSVLYENGWFLIENLGRYGRVRRIKLEAMRDELLRRKELEQKK